MDMDSLASAQAFAEGYLYAVILSISLKTSLEMASMEKYKYVMESPDAAGMISCMYSLNLCNLLIPSNNNNSCGGKASADDGGRGGKETRSRSPQTKEREGRHVRNRTRKPAC
jgi:hypothetical protein